MNRHWKYSRSSKSIASSKLPILSSPARKRSFDPSPCRNTQIPSNSFSPKLKKSLHHISATENQPKKFKRYFTPFTKSFIELSQSPTLYDLRGSNLKKEIESAKKLVNFQVLEKRNERILEECSQLTRSKMTQIEYEREKLNSLKLKSKKTHHLAPEFFNLVKKGDRETLSKLLVIFPELSNERDSTGQTALHWATRRSNFDLVKLLVSTNANVMLTDIVGRRAEDIAKQKSLNDIFKFLSAERRKLRHSNFYQFSDLKFQPNKALAGF